MRVLVVGANGQLGSDIVKALKGYEVIGIDKEHDITNELIISYIIEIKPDIVIHTAAFVDVDLAEKKCLDAIRVNVLGTKNIVLACKRIGAKLVYISTDYVFDGLGQNFYEIDDVKNGLSIYGISKSIGEDFVRYILDKYYIIRVSWLFGKNGNNFIKKMLSLSNRKEIDVVSDQIGSITYTVDLSYLICDIIKTDRYGIFHATNEGVISWYDLALEIFRIKGINIKVNPITTKDYLDKYPNSARRPLNSRLSKASLINNGFSLLPFWKDAINRFMKEIDYE